jgi:hypothetical protein
MHGDTGGSQEDRETETSEHRDTGRDSEIHFTWGGREIEAGATQRHRQRFGDTDHRGQRDRETG